MNRDIEQLVTEFVGKVERVFTQRNKLQIEELIAKLTNGKKHVNVTAKGHVTSGKRSPEELEKMQMRLLGYIAKNPGQNCETIARGMGVDTDELALPLRKMVGNELKTQGKARGRKYWAK